MLGKSVRNKECRELDYVNGDSKQRRSFLVDIGKWLDKFTLQQLLYCTYERKKSSEEYMKLVLYVIRRRFFEAGARQ